MQVLGLGAAGCRGAESLERGGVGTRLRDGESILVAESNYDGVVDSNGVTRTSGVFDQREIKVARGYDST